MKTIFVHFSLKLNEIFRKFVDLGLGFGFHVHFWGGFGCGHDTQTSKNWQSEGTNQILIQFFIRISTNFSLIGYFK